MAQYSSSNRKKSFVALLFLVFVFLSASSYYVEAPNSQPQTSAHNPRLCNFDDLYVMGYRDFKDLESCNVGLLRMCRVEKIYQLGDSISNVGNLIREVPVGAAAPFARQPYGSNFPAGPTGRASNGNLMIDYFGRRAVLPGFNCRLDCKEAFPKQAATDIPGPDFDIAGVVRSFALKGFNAREMVALLGGGHSTGKIHCNFILHRLFNFNRTTQPDPSINPEFLEILRSECSHPSSPPSQSPSASQKSTPTPAALLANRAMPMDYEGASNGFGEVYYRSLMQGKGLLVADQQLTARADTKSWVETYASDMPQFRRDFGLAMFKLTHIQGDLDRGGEVRLNCRKIN